MAATRNIVPFPTSQQVQPIPKPQEVTQGDLSYILGTCQELERLKPLLAEAEQTVRSRLESGAEVERGTHIASLTEHWRKSTGWREVAERLGNRLYGDGRGHGYCENVLSSTKPTLTVSLHVA